MQNLAAIKELIARQKCRFYELHCRDSRAVNSKSFVATNTKDEDPSVEECIRQVEDTCNLIWESNPYALFEIQYWSTNGSANKKYGPFTFANTTQPANAPTTSMGGFGGVPAEAMQREFLGALQVQQQLMAPQMELMRNQTALDFDRRMFEKEKADFAEWKRKEMEEVEELKEQYGSRYQATKKGFEEFAMQNIGKIANLFMTGGNSSQPTPLAGAPAVEEEQLSEEEELIKSIADNIAQKHYDGLLNYDQIMLIGVGVQKAIENLTSPEAADVQEKHKAWQQSNFNEQETTQYEPQTPAENEPIHTQ